MNSDEHETRKKIINISLKNENEHKDTTKINRHTAVIRMHINANILIEFNCIFIALNMKTKKKYLTI